MDLSGIFAVFLGLLLMIVIVVFDFTMLQMLARP
jgi:hypothetical protein